MDSKVAMSILAATVTTIAAAVCTRKLIVDKKQSNSPEKRLLKKKQRSMVKSLSAIETDSKKLLEDIKKVQGIILEFMKNNNSSKKQQNNIETENYEKTVIENDIDSNASIDSTDSVEKTIIDNEGKEEEEEEEEKVENSTIISTSLHEKEEEEADKNKNKNKKLASLQSIRVDGYLIEMKIKGLDEYLLRLLERLDSLRPKALMEEVREIYSDKEGLEDVIPYIEHKVEKIKKRKKALVLKIQSYLENVDKLAGTVSGKNGDIEVVESVAKLWEVKDGKKKHLNFKFKL